MQDYKGLGVITAKDSIEATKAIIASEADGRQNGLYCRFPGLNVAMLKYFRFGNTNLLAGRSGSGKSLFQSMLRNDFVNGLVTLGNIKNIRPDLGTEYIDNGPLGIYYPESRITQMTNGELIIKPLNENCIHDVVGVHFGYEMSPMSENIRSVGTILGKSYAHILSSEYNKTTKSFNTLTKEERIEIETILDCLGIRKEYYIPVSGNVMQMTATIDYLQQENPTAKLVISVDHGLLTRKLGSEGTEALVNDLAHFCNDTTSTYDALMFMLLQLNNEIEQPERLKNKEMHFPSKPDIHYGSQVWWAADNVMVIHVPRLLRIERYGVDELDTNSLAHLAVIKSRFGEVGNVWFREYYAKGRLLEVPMNVLKNPPNFNPLKRGAIGSH